MLKPASYAQRGLTFRSRGRVQAALARAPELARWASSACREYAVRQPAVPAPRMIDARCQRGSLYAAIPLPRLRRPVDHWSDRQQRETRAARADELEYALPVTGDRLHFERTTRRQHRPGLFAPIGFFKPCCVYCSHFVSSWANAQLFHRAGASRQAAQSPHVRRWAAAR